MAVEQSLSLFQEKYKIDPQNSECIEIMNNKANELVTTLEGRSREEDNRISGISLDEKLKQKYNSKNWHRIEQEKQKLLPFCKTIAPKSLIRLGDGELRILKERKQLAKSLVDAIKNADLLGLPDHFDGTIRCHALSWDKQLCECLGNDYDLRVNEEKIISSYIFTFIPEIIGEFVEGKRILWITANAKKIVCNLTNEQFCFYYNLNGIKENCYIEVPEASGALPLTDYEQVLLHVQNGLREKQDYDIALVGAGALGKIYCNIIKTEYKKQAIDIGSLMSAYKGLRNRLVFEKGRELDFLVWSDKFK